MRSVSRVHISALSAGKILSVLSIAALGAGCGLSNPSKLWDDPQTTGSVSAPAADTIVTGSNNPYTPPPRAYGQPARGGVVVVRPGDTVYSIARRNGTNVPRLAAANRLRPPYTISSGQRLIIPTVQADYTQTGSIAPARQAVQQPRPTYQPPVRQGQVVTAQAGDTLYSIGRRYGVHVNELARINRIPPPYNIRLGQRIQIPGRALAPRQAAAPRVQPTRTAAAPAASLPGRLQS